jgi:hypothetical protein
LEEEKNQLQTKIKLKKEAKGDVIAPMIIFGKPIHRKFNKLIFLLLTFILLGVLYAII